MSHKCSQLIAGIESIKTKQSELCELIATLDVQKHNQNIAKTIIIELISHIYRLRKRLISDIKETDELLVDELFFVEYSQLTEAQILEMLSILIKKSANGEKLRKKELVFLYDLNSQVYDYKNYDFSFSQINSNDTKLDVDEINVICNRILFLRENQIKSDLSIVKNISAKDICISSDDDETIFMSGKKYFYGNLDIIRPRARAYDKLKLPEVVEGSIFLNQFSCPGLKLPKIITSNLNLQELTENYGMIFPEEVGGSVFLPGIASAKDLKFPNYIGGDLHLDGLTNDNGLELPHFVGGTVYLHSMPPLYKDGLIEKYPLLKFNS